MSSNIHQFLTILSFSYFACTILSPNSPAWIFLSLIRVKSCWTKRLVEVACAEKGQLKSVSRYLITALYNSNASLLEAPQYNNFLCHERIGRNAVMSVLLQCTSPDRYVLSYVDKPRVLNRLIKIVVIIFPLLYIVTP
ncbi:hypothetical protein Plhal710r2_c015g0066931 [Plasmopara halstedii]